MKTNRRVAPILRLDAVLALVFLIALAVVAPGCRMVQATAEIPANAARAVGGGDKKAKSPPDPVVLQQEIFRFADEFLAQANDEYSRVATAWPEAPTQRLLESQVNLNYRFLEIASGPNAYANLVDLVFAVVLARFQVERFVAKEHPEELTGPVVALLKEYQRQILDVARDTLGAEQQELLRKNIRVWLEANMTSESSLHTRYPGPISELLGKAATERGTETSSLLGVLMLDPLAGLDPTVREVAQVRLFAERAMYVAQRMPKVLRLEMELLKVRSLATPEVAQMLHNVDAVGRTITELPNRLQAEREAIIQALKDEREGLTVLVQDTRGALDAGSRAMENLNTVVLSTDTFLGHLGLHEKPAGPDDVSAPAAPAAAAGQATPAEPFRIQDYTAAANQLAATAGQLNTLITTLDQTLATATSDEVAARVDGAVARSRDVVDHAFWRAILFVALCCVMVLATVLAWRFLLRKGAR